MMMKQFIIIELVSNHDYSVSDSDIVNVFQVFGTMSEVKESKREIISHKFQRIVSYSHRERKSISRHLKC